MSNEKYCDQPIFNSEIPGLKMALDVTPTRNHWREMYLEALRDNAKMAEKFSEHLQAIEGCYQEKLNELQSQMDRKLEEGFEEAYRNY